VVSGPFMVKSFTPEVELEMVPNPEYFGEAPKLEELKLVKESDSTAAVTALRAGALDALWSIPASDAKQLESEPELQMIEPAVTGVYVSWEMDLTAPPFNDIRAREALAYATDRESILNAAYYGLGSVSKTNTPLAENSQWFGGNLKEYPYDIEKAKKLFAEAGVTELTWWGVSDQYPEWNTSAQILQASLKEAGVKLNIKNSDLSTWPNKFYPAGKSFPGLVVPNFQSYQANPYSQFSFPLAGRCECNWNSKEFDSTYNKALGTADEGARNELWDQAQEIINKEVPLIIPVQPKVVTAAKSDVAGVWVDPTGTPHFESAGFAG
jgi:peptide/nickel transport system substrate-binding protein